MKTDCCCPPPTNSSACGCCEGVEALTPLPTANRPGLPVLSYRIGTHAALLETMKARLSSSDYRKLDELTTREADDPAIALLDAWATVADVLTFYQERVANEGYLRTATERRSVLELARLVGYQPRPGVASSAYLAYTLDDNLKEEVIIPTGARSQSVPGPGELPQSFEINEELKARARWNNLRPRMTQPQTPTSIKPDPSPGNARATQGPRVYLKGIATNVRPNDPLLIDFLGDDKHIPEFFRAKEVVADAAADRTLVTLVQEKATEAASGREAHEAEATATRAPVGPATGLIDALAAPPSVQPHNSLGLQRKLETLFLGSGIEPGVCGLSFADAETSVPPSVLLREILVGGEASHAALKAFAPVLRETLAMAATNAQVTEENPIRVYALRVSASLFGHNAPKEPRFDSETGQILRQTRWPEWGLADDEQRARLFLDRDYKTIVPNSYIAIQYPEEGVEGTTYNVRPFKIGGAVTRSRNAYGLSTSTTVISLADEQSWWEPHCGEPHDFIRGATVYAESQRLELAEEPIKGPVCGGTDHLLELDDVYEGLESGRWVVVSGERDIAGTSGVRFSELAMLASVTQNVGTQVTAPKAQGNNNASAITEPKIQLLPGDKTRTFVTLASKLEYCFKRDTVTIYGNVVKATHGETRKEALGSGDGAKVLQTFILKQPPLTYVSASNPSGVDSTLKVYVNDVQWHETDSLAGLSPSDRHFITKTDDEAKTTVVFGNGREGARLPTGIENIKAEYRNGIGKPGNVKAGQITLLTTRPLGVKEVINPLRAAGGADRESRDQARKNAPLAVRALDRLVSVQDYEDFARIYAGIGEARAVEMSDGRRRLVHITIAGADDIPIDTSSDLYRNLRQALLDFGDPYQAIQLEIRELMLIVISAGIRILPDYQWEPVVTQVRSALLDAFSFDRRELGQDVLLSEVLSVMQSVRGVAYVDVEAFGGIPEKNVKEVEESIGDQKVKVKERLLLTPQEIAGSVQTLVEVSRMEGPPKTRVAVNMAGLEDGTLQPAQLAFLTPEVPETLILNQIT